MLLVLFKIAGQTNSQPFSDILSDLCLQQQQKNHQEQLLLAASYLRQQKQQQMSNTNGKRSFEDVKAEAKDCANTQTAFLNINNTATTNKRKEGKKMKILASENEATEQQQQSPNSQLHECFKCELIFRNYEMFCAHKMLHEIQGQSTEDESNNNSNNTSVVDPSNSCLNNVQSNNLNTNNSQDLNRLIAESIHQQQQQQGQQPKSQLTDNSAEYLECNQCNLKMSNALEFFIHVQSFHANGIQTTDYSSGSTSELKQES